jgi:hypothetical protein
MSDMQIKRKFKEIGIVVTYAIMVVLLLLLPLLAVRQSSENAAQLETILVRMDENNKIALERAIFVNISTISCMLLVDPDERDTSSMAQCIRQGIEDLELHELDPITD